MTTTPRSDKTSDWDAGPVIRWLLDEGRFKPDTDELVQGLGEYMSAQAAPLWRLRLSMRTLHPLIAAITSVWERDTGETERIVSTHGLEQRSGYIGSPMAVIQETGKAFRKSLAAPLTSQDHNVLHELKARGGTDYYGTPMTLSDGTLAIMIAATDDGAGFCEHDITRFEAIASVLAPIADVYKARRISLAVAEAYLGSRTGKRVLDGRITRGDIETINAAILVSDIRDWTGINRRHAPDKAVALANRYFEIIAEAVEANGGEILKFIGDGVLAVFPAGEAGAQDEACRRALAAAKQSLRSARTSDPPLGAAFGMGLHFGEVLYGNVGSATRIDFTVLGQAVNIAARIEGLCSQLDTPILFSQTFAHHLDEPAEVISEEPLKGLDGTMPILTAAEPF